MRSDDPETDDPIAVTALIAETADRGRFPLRVEFGRPYLRSRDPDVWACPVSVFPIHERLADVAGGDSLQALCLASRLAVSLLEAFVASGGQLRNDDGTAFSTDVLGFAGPRGQPHRPAAASRSRRVRRKRRAARRERK